MLPEQTGTIPVLTVTEIVRAIGPLALADYVDHFRARVLQDAIAEATASYWLRRAATFDAVGTQSCESIAQACRNAASLALVQDQGSGE